MRCQPADVDVLQAMSEATEHMLSSVWASGGTRDVYADYNDLTLSITTNALFGVDMSSSQSAGISSKLASHYCIINPILIGWHITREGVWVLLSLGLAACEDSGLFPAQQHHKAAQLHTTIARCLLSTTSQLLRLAHASVTATCVMHDGAYSMKGSHSQASVPTPPVVSLNVFACRCSAGGL